MHIDWKYFTKEFHEVPEMIVGTIVLYILVIAYTRLFGLKSFSKMTGFDFLNTLAIGNLLAMSAATSSPSLFVGAILIGLLYLLNSVISRVTFMSEKAEDIADNSPKLLMRNGKILEENLEKTKITKNELRGKLREANVITLDQVLAVVLETTGDISVLHTTNEQELDDFLLADIMT
jgi:uncharacterized membrane protein YcaP (DUF421 family)